MFAEGHSLTVVTGYRELIYKPLSSTGGPDFALQSISVTFGPEQTMASVNVSIVEDSNIEDTEMFSATLTTTQSNVMIDADTATVTILDDDGNNDNERTH